VNQDYNGATIEQAKQLKISRASTLQCCNCKKQISQQFVHQHCNNVNKQDIQHHLHQ
jgi:hypothetical protein